MELDAYRKMAETEDEHWWFCGRRAIAETIIAGLDLPNGASIVEIGAGTGGNISMLEQFSSVQAIEMSDLARQIAWEKSGREFLYGYLPDSIPGLRLIGWIGSSCSTYSSTLSRTRRRWLPCAAC